MTDYSEITAEEISPDKPITATLLAKMRDNPLAIAEGAAGAPKIGSAALDVGVITTVKIGNGAVSADKISWTLPEASQTLASGANYILPPGLYLIEASAVISEGGGLAYYAGPQIKLNNTWIRATFPPVGPIGGGAVSYVATVVSDGYNARLYNGTAYSFTFHFRKLA